MTVLAILLLLLVVGVAFLNMDVVTLNLFFMNLSVPLWLVILAVTLIGILAGALLAGTGVSNARDEYRRREEDLKDKLDQKDEELQAARQETSEAANRARRETEMEYQMQQKEQEIEELRRQLLLMQENQAPTQHTTVTTERATEPVMDDHYPNDPIIVAEPADETDPLRRG